MPLTATEVRKIADLARLELSNDELTRYSSQLSQILHYVEKLNGLDLDAIQPTAHAVFVPTPLREDETKPFLGHQEALSVAPDREENFFRVPKVF